MSTDCDIPFQERTAGEVYGCVMEMGRNAYENTLHAYSAVWTAPGSATVFDWAVVIFMPLVFIGAILKVIEVCKRVEFHRLKWLDGFGVLPRSAIGD